MYTEWDCAKNWSKANCDQIPKTESGEKNHKKWGWDLGSYSGVAEDSSCLGCDTLSLGEWNNMILTMSCHKRLEFLSKLLSEAVPFTFSIKVRGVYAGVRQVSK